MKVFESGKAQFATFNEEDEQPYILNLSNLDINPDTESVLVVGEALSQVIDGEFGYAKVIETHRLVR